MAALSFDDFKTNVPRADANMVCLSDAEIDVSDV
jgi:hypothetical protein